MSLQNVSFLKWGGCFLPFEISGCGLRALLLGVGVFIDKVGGVYISNITHITHPHAQVHITHTSQCVCLWRLCSFPFAVLLL